MTDGGQTGLADFSAGSDEHRPEAEAAAVAGSNDNGADTVVDPEYETLPEADGTVELQVMQVDYTIRGRGDDERPILHLFGRTAERGLEHVRVHGFKPYFYAPAENIDEERIAGYEGLTGFETEDDNGDPYESIRGEQLAKIFGRTPRDVGQVRDDFDHYEADILFPNRLLIDKGITGGVRVPQRRAEADGPVDVYHTELTPVEIDADPRICTLDIEVDDRRGFPEDGEEPIICLVTHDSYKNEYIGWIFDPEDGNGDLPTELPEYDLLREDDQQDVAGTADADVEIRAFDTEPAMLDAVLSYVEQTDPDVLTGWNFDDFDAPYLRSLH